LSTATDTVTTSISRALRRSRAASIGLVAMPFLLYPGLTYKSYITALL